MSKLDSLNKSKEPEKIVINLSRFLVCKEHKSSEENKKLLDLYKLKYILRNTSLPSFSRDIQLTFHTEVHHTPDGVINNNSTKEEINDIGIYLFQKINVNNQQFTVFFDNGCSDFVITPDAVKRLGSAATKIYDGEVKIGGVGRTSTQSQHGIYSVKIQLNNGCLLYTSPSPRDS